MLGFHTPLSYNEASKKQRGILGQEGGKEARGASKLAWSDPAPLTAQSHLTLGSADHPPIKDSQSALLCGSCKSCNKDGALLRAKAALQSKQEKTGHKADKNSP